MLGNFSATTIIFCEKESLFPPLVSAWGRLMVAFASASPGRTAPPPLQLQKRADPSWGRDPVAQFGHCLLTPLTIIGKLLQRDLLEDSKYPRQETPCTSRGSSVSSGLSTPARCGCSRQATSEPVHAPNAPRTPTSPSSHNSPSVLGTSLPTPIPTLPPTLRQVQLRSLDPLSLEDDDAEWGDVDDNCGIENTNTAGETPRRASRRAVASAGATWGDDDAPDAEHRALPPPPRDDSAAAAEGLQLFEFDM